jgi:hypothetical protein
MGWDNSRLRGVKCMTLTPLGALKCEFLVNECKDDFRSLTHTVSRSGHQLLKVTVSQFRFH